MSEPLHAMDTDDRAACRARGKVTTVNVDVTCPKCRKMLRLP